MIRYGRSNIGYCHNAGILIYPPGQSLKGGGPVVVKHLSTANIIQLLSDKVVFQQWLDNYSNEKDGEWHHGSQKMCTSVTYFYTLLYWNSINVYKCQSIGGVTPLTHWIQNRHATTVVNPPVRSMEIYGICMEIQHVMKHSKRISSIT